MTEPTISALSDSVRIDSFLRYIVQESNSYPYMWYLKSLMNIGEEKMLSFVNDYCEGAHENILKRLGTINYDKQTGYGNDKICASAAGRIRTACDCPNAQVYFLVGGTQTNQVVIDSMLLPYEGVCAAVTGHINAHEAGAVEFTGRKVLGLPSHEGKVSAADLEAYASSFYEDESHEHMVFPGMLYISHPTEYGTLYTVSELTELRSVCRRYNMSIFMDGARLGYGLAAALRTDSGTVSSSQSNQPDNDAVKTVQDTYALPTLADIARLTDVFYIGGTKVGALFGEAVVFTKENAPAHFPNLIKKHGAMLAKGWLLGVQFDELFTDDLYTRIGRHAVDCANRLRSALLAKGYSLYIPNPTNQVFVTLEDTRLPALAEHVRFGIWERLDPTHTVVRFCTSWATRDEDIDALIALL